MRTAQAAERWIGFEENRDIYPNLQYLTTGDSRVRDSHRLLHKVIRPIDDVFWDLYYPPNGWRCRCRVEPTRGEPTKKAPAIETLPMFRNNPAKTGSVFSEKHPYYARHEQLKKRIRERSDAFALKAYTESQQKTFDSYRGREDYEPVGFLAAAGGFLVRHKKHRPLSSEQRALVDRLVKRGDGVVLPPALRDFSEKGWELEINGARFTVETSTGTRVSVRDRLLEGVQKTRRVLIELRGLDTSSVRAGIAEALKKMEDKNALQGVVLVYQDKRVFIDRASLNRPESLKQIIAELQ